MANSTDQEPDALARDFAGLRAWTASAPGIALLLSAAGRILDLNLALAEALGGSREALIGADFPGQLEASRRADWTASFQRAVNDPAGCREDLELGGRWYDCAWMRREDASGAPAGIVLFGWDITARRQSEERYRAFMANSTEGIWRYEGDQPIPIALPPEEQIRRFFEVAYLAECNDAMARMYGFERGEQMVGLRLKDLAGGDPRNLKHLRDFITSGYRLVNSRSFELDCAGRIRHFLNSMAGVIEGGCLVRAWGVQRDVTAQNELEEKLRQAQKMDAIGQLAGGVAHDFNNVLTSIVLQVEVLERGPMLPREAREAIRELGLAAERAADLTRQLLIFSRQSVLETRPADLNEVVENLLKMLRRLIGEDIDLRFDPRPLPLIEGDEGMIEQVLLNLAVNSRDAMPKGGRITLATEAIEFTPGQVPGNPNARPGRFVRLTFADTGCGIPPEALPRIFEPFFTTKPPGKGTGLGLAIVHGIIGQHQGWVDVTSKVGEGTSFTLCLPVMEQPATVTLPQDPAAVPGGRERVLLVEDEAGVRKVLVESLALLGYHVVEAANGPAALRAWEEQKEPIDLLFADMVMPGGMTGLELAEALRRKQPGLKTIICSGYSTESFPEAARVLRVQKPLTLARLSRAIRQCLDQE